LSSPQRHAARSARRPGCRCYSDRAIVCRQRCGLQPLAGFAAAVHRHAPAPPAPFPPVPPPLARDTLLHCLRDLAVGEAIEVDVREVIGSCNDELLARCRRRRPDGVQLLAVARQTAGRGRKHRAGSAPRAALLFALAVPLAVRPAALPAVTLAVGVELAAALVTRGLDVTLKWPNDLLLDGRKLAGILCELAVDGDGAVSLVVGIGVNVAFTPEEAAHVGQPVAALAEAVEPQSVLAAREAWIAALAAAALHAVRGFERAGFAAWRDAFNLRLHGRGAAADILDDGRCVAHGRIVEVDATGRLVLDTAAGRCSILAGEVSLRTVPTP
jgi:BirA family biotin operon repressor/biotin-[acetyl-CoA-carboxylase] ligase